MEDLFEQLRNLHNKPIENKQEILTEIETLLLFKTYIQKSSFQKLLVKNNLTQKTLSHIGELKMNLDRKLDFITELFPEKNDFYEIMNNYKKLDPKGYKYYTTYYETGEFPEE